MTWILLHFSWRIRQWQNFEIGQHLSKLWTDV